MVHKLQQYIANEGNVVLAFLFGSRAIQRETKQSDIDIAVYLKDVGQEDRIWKDITRIAEKEVDLILLNTAPANLASNIFKTGIPLIIKDRTLYWKLYLEQSAQAEDFAHFAQDYWNIYQRARFLAPQKLSSLLKKNQPLKHTRTRFPSLRRSLV